jgi:hypothetical protein
MTKRRPTETEALERAEADAAAAAAAEATAIAPAAEAAHVDPEREPAVGPAGPESAAATGDVDSGPTAADYSIAFSPRNVAVGLAIVAGLVAFAARRHRQKRGAGRRDS